MTTQRSDLIHEMGERLNWAKRVQASLDGSDGSLTIHEVGDYSIVDDGESRTLIETETHHKAIESVIENVLYGSYDAIIWDPDWTDAERKSEVLGKAYEQYCSTTSDDHVWCNGNCHNDQQRITDEIDDRELLDAIGDLLDLDLNTDVNPIFRDGGIDLKQLHRKYLGE